MKDIFIDANIANKFSNPPNDHYKNLIKWLIKVDKTHPENNAILMVSDKIINEYRGGNNGCYSATSIAVIINTLLIQKRLKKQSNQEIKAFCNKYITKSIKRTLRSNEKDWNHFPLIFYSQRKFAIIGDHNFHYDIINFPKFKKDIQVFESPECNFAA